MGERTLATSYLSLRRAIGAIGLLLPAVLPLGDRLLRGPGLQESISDFYATPMRDELVGALFCTGGFLLNYAGYEPIDDIATSIAGLTAFGIALFPDTGRTQIAHYVFAATFFVTLALTSLLLFTRTGDRPPTRRKLARNRVYRTAGAVMLVCLVAIAIYSLALENTAVAKYNPVFWLETVMLWAFGISWAVKGETLLRDRR